MTDRSQEDAGWFYGPTAAWALSLAGFAPFALLALALTTLSATHPLYILVLDAFRTYGAVILSFLGGIRWGLQLAPSQPRSLGLSASVVPAIAAWLALFLPPALGITVLLVAFCVQGAWDSISFHGEERLIWFARLRILLTLLVAAAHLLALLSLA